MFRTGAQLFLLTLLAGLALFWEAQQEPLASWDQDFSDFLARHSRHPSPTAPLTLVEIDDASLADHPWPWSPLDFSLFFQAVLPFQPEVVATDEVLDWTRQALPAEQQGKLPQYEKILRDSILRTPKALLGAVLGYPEDPTVIPPLQEVPLVKRVLGEVREVPEFTAIEQQPPEEFRLSPTIGFVNLPSARPRYHSVPLVLRYRGQVIPSFVLQALMLWKKLTPDEISVTLGSHVQLGADLRVPIDAAGRMRVDFGTPRTAFGFDSLLLAAEQIEAGQKPNVPVQQMARGIVLLSRSEKNARTLPLAAMRKGSPGELFAAAIATIQNQSFIRRVPWWGAVLGLLAVAAVAYRVPRMTRLQAIGVGLGVLVLHIVISLAVFNRSLHWMPLVPVVGAVLFMVLYRVVTPDSAGKPKRPVIL